MNTGIGGRRLVLRFTIPAAGLVAMIGLALLYQFEPESYYRVLAFIGIAPFRYPFLDFQVILASVDCWQHDIDVYVNNPCDVLQRLFNYSPLWLRFSILPDKDWTNSLGLCLAVSFFLALAALPSPRSGKELLLRLIATLSPVTTFAVERGNIDLLIFVIATTAGVLLLRPLRGRLAGYAMIVIAGLLKIYPLVLMVLTLRERPRVFLWINSAAAAVVLATGVYFHAEVVKMVQNMPTSVAFANLFGAHYLPDVIVTKIGAALDSGFSLRLMRLVAYAALLVATAGWFFCMVRWCDFRMALARLPKPERIFLLIGAALIGGCFFAGSNIGYRGIHLLFTLPGVLAIARVGGNVGVRRVAVQTYVLVVTLTWVGFFIWKGLFRAGSIYSILASWIGEAASTAAMRFLWLLSQIAWWQVATVFVAILIGCGTNWLEAVSKGTCCVGSRER
jgi:hypothetical protein